MNELTLARVFFTDGQIELRPVSSIWVCSNTTPLNLEEFRVEDDVEKFIVFREKVNCISIFKGEFVNVRHGRSRHDRQDRN